MNPRRLLWQLFPAFLAVLLAALLVMGLALPRSVRQFHLQQLAQELEVRARLAMATLLPLLQAQNFAGIDAGCKELGRSTGTRFTLVLPDGRVVGDSDSPLAAMDNHADRPEIRQAMAGGIGQSVRHSPTLGETLMYIAVPLQQGGLQAVVRAALPITAIEQQLHRLQRQQLGWSLAALLMAITLSWWLARRISRPLEVMQRGAGRFAAGDFAARLPAFGSAETTALADSLNRMATQMDERLRSLLQQRNEQDAVLSSMVEGVLAVDNGERILRINQAAGRLLGLDEATAGGRNLREAVRKADVQAFVEKTLTGNGPVEGEIMLLGDEGERYLQANGTLLRDARGKRIGALVVFNDISRLRRMERVRRDFVANVSHELKTPITAIKGFVETLLDDGALRDHGQARIFLGIVLKQSNRLNAIIEDLLDLSRIEQDVEREQIELVPGPLAPVLHSAAQSWMLKADAAGVRVELEVPPELQARINAPLLEQALINLVDNAIKYSPRGGRVLVRAERDGARVRLTVRDWGCGIASEHLPRLFERFYRVDKARSRKQGGTGLGLAIVKHIAQAHGGQVTVASSLGEGSTFTLQLPT